MKKSNNTKTTRTRHDFFYFLVATRYYVNYNKLLKDSFDQDFLESAKLWKDEFRNSDLKDIEDKKIKELIEKYKINELASNLFGLRTFGSIIIVHSAMCLESLINDYCVINKSSNYFKNYIDKIDTASKWLIVPKLIKNNEIPTDSHAYELIKKLFTLRNSLVHPKSRQFESKDDNNDEFQKESAKFLTKDVPLSYRAIKEATQALYEIDPDFEYLADYRWLWDKEGKFNNISELYSFYSSFFSKLDLKINGG